METNSGARAGQTGSRSVTRRRALQWLRQKAPYYAKHSADGFESLTRTLVGLAEAEGYPLEVEEIREAAFYAVVGMEWSSPDEGEVGPPEDDSELLSAFEERLRQVGMTREHDLWRCPSCLHYSLIVSKGGKGLRVSCWSYSKRRHYCSTPQVIRALGGGWTVCDLFDTAHRKPGWAEQLDRDLFGRPLDNRARATTRSVNGSVRQHAPSRDNTVLREAAMENSPTGACCITSVTRACCPQDVVVSGWRMGIDDLETAGAGLDLEGDLLRHGPLPQDATEDDWLVAGRLLGWLRTGWSLGEVRELALSNRELAARMGWGREAGKGRANKVLKRLALSGAFLRRELPKKPGHARGIFVYSLPLGPNGDLAEALTEALR